MPDKTIDLSDGPISSTASIAARKWLSISVFVIVIVVGIWLLFWALITQTLGNPKLPGEFGDMFGAVNGLFSGLAFAGIIVAILMQREDLKLQQKELTESRKAQEAQVKALVLAAKLNGTVALLANRSIVFQADEVMQEIVEEAMDWEQRRVRDIWRYLNDLDAL